MGCSTLARAKHVAVSVTMTLVSMGCDAPHANVDEILPEFDHTALDIQRLEGRVLVRGDSIGFPAGMLVRGEFLIIADYPGRPAGAFHIADLATGRMLMSAGRAGKAPGEYSGIPDLLPDPIATDCFWTFDANASRLTEYDISHLLAGDTHGERTIQLTFPRIMYNVGFINSRRLVGLGLSAEGRIALIDLDTGGVEFHGELPAASNHIPESIVQHAYQSQLGISPDRSRIVLAHWRGGGFEVYDSTGALLRRFDGPFPFDPDYVVDEGPRGPIMRGGWRNRYGYLDVVTTDSLIVALFSGRAEAHYRRDSWIGEYVHVFSWNGDFRKAYRLDRAVHNIALTDNGHALLAAIEVDPTLGEPAILRYEIVLPGQQH